MMTLLLVTLVWVAINMVWWIMYLRRVRYLMSLATVTSIPGPPGPVGMQGPPGIQGPPGTTPTERDMDNELNELNELMEWRWVDDKGRAMTEWKRGNLPPVLDLTDNKGAMHVEVRVAPDAA